MLNNWRKYIAIVARWLIGKDDALYLNGHQANGNNPDRPAMRYR